MDLVRTTDAFELRGQQYAGFPLLLDNEMRVVEPAFRFLTYHLIHRGRVGSRKSWLTLGQHLYDYFGFLEAYSIHWDDVARGEDHSVVAAYRDWAVRNGNARTTINQRLRTIVRFYQYALRQHWIETLPYALEEVRVSKAPGFLAHTDATGGKMQSPDVMLKMVKKLPGFLTTDQIRLLLGAISNPTHKLMTRMGLQVGLRREEIATFPSAYVFDPVAQRRREAMLRIELRPGEMAIKGDKPRPIDISRELMRDLWFYRIHRRPALAQLTADNPVPLFLTEQGKPWANDGQGFLMILRALSEVLGFHVNPHKLRHTYATHTLYALQRRSSNINPLVYLQQQLGHASINTTMVYLHLVKALADSAALAYDDEITQMSRDDANG